MHLRWLFFTLYIYICDIEIPWQRELWHGRFLLLPIQVCASFVLHFFNLPSILKKNSHWMQKFRPNDRWIMEKKTLQASLDETLIQLKISTTVSFRVSHSCSTSTRLCREQPLLCAKKAPTKKQAPKLLYNFMRLLMDHFIGKVVSLQIASHSNSTTSMTLQFNS